MHDDALKIIAHSVSYKSNLNFMYEQVRAYIYLEEYENALRVLDKMSDVAKEKKSIGIDVEKN